MGNKLCRRLPVHRSRRRPPTVFQRVRQCQQRQSRDGRDTSRSKGFGFVEMGSDAEAQQTIAGMNGQSLGGRSLVVNEARPMEPRPPRSGGGGFGGGRREGGFGGGGGGYGGGGNDGGFRSPTAAVAVVKAVAAAARRLLEPSHLAD